MALAHFMLLSLTKAAHAAMSDAAWQEIRVRSRCQFCSGENSAFSGEVRGTADPSAPLGMTKERATSLWKVVAEPKAFFSTLGGPQAHDSSGEIPRFYGNTKS
jgi:hypothetical protein